MTPIAITLGFSGSRKWLDAAGRADLDTSAVNSAVEAWLLGRMNRLTGDLDLSANFFLCGVSQIAIGADMAFTRACQSLNIPQQILLPQHRDAYLDATEKDGHPDFSATDRAAASALLESPHIIEDRLVSHAPDRYLRFEETNVELVRRSDLLICLTMASSEARPGGTHDVITRAAKARKPVLWVRMTVHGEEVAFTEEWLGNPDEIKSRFAEQSSLQNEIFGVDLDRPDTADGFPAVELLLRAVMKHTEREAGKHSRFFKSAAFIIVGTHCLATVLATAAMKVHLEVFLVGLLGMEIVLLLTGYFVHHHLHHRGAASRWALHRLVAEITRSVLSLKDWHLSLGYLHGLTLPDVVRPYLRTVELLHLRATRISKSGGWQPSRDAYLADRLEGQLLFYQRQGQRAERLLNYAQQFFLWSSRLAILCTALKVLFVLSHLSFAGLGAADWKALLGFLAVILPVVAVGALSLAAANDLEARHHSFREMLRFLSLQKDRMNSASSERESSRLVIETEARLIGETANWFSRRSYTGVA